MTPPIGMGSLSHRVWVQLWLVRMSMWVYRTDCKYSRLDIIIVAANIVILQRFIEIIW